MKIDFNKKYTTIAIYACIVVLFSIVCVYFAIHSETLNAVLSIIWGILGPIIFGAIIAYILTPIVNFLERKVFISKECRAARKNAKKDALEKNITSKEKIEALMLEASNEASRKKYNERLSSGKIKKNENLVDKIKRARVRRSKFGIRALSILCTYIIIIAIVSAIVWAAASSVNDLYITIKNFTTALPQHIAALCAKYEWFNAAYSMIRDELNITNLSNMISNLLSNSFDYVALATSFILGVFTQVKNVILMVIFSIYFLIYKEFLAEQASRIVEAVFKPKKVAFIRHVVKEFNLRFGCFLQGRILDSLCIGVISFVVFMICAIPYYPMIAVIVGITNIIPFFGPFLGAIPSAIIILIVEPRKVILFIILILIIQQLDGNVIGPRILGTAIGLKPVWIIIAIIVMSGLFGIFGMFFGVPIFAVIYTLVSEAINKRLAIKLAAKVVAENESVDFIRFLMEKDEEIDKSLEDN